MIMNESGDIRSHSIVVVLSAVWRFTVIPEVLRVCKRNVHIVVNLPGRPSLLTRAYTCLPRSLAKALQRWSAYVLRA